MSVIKEWYSGNGLGKNCLWSDNLGEAFQQANFADRPLEAERLISEYLGQPVKIERIQDIQSDRFGKVSFFGYDLK